MHLQHRYEAKRGRGFVFVTVFLEDVGFAILISKLDRIRTKIYEVTMYDVCIKDIYRTYT